MVSFAVAMNRINVDLVNIGFDVDLVEVDIVNIPFVVAAMSHRAHMLSMQQCCFCYFTALRICDERPCLQGLDPHD